jgi:hypothetical protein
MLTPMNYRHGFQRLYAVLTVAWVAVVLTASIQDRPRAHKPDIWDQAAALSLTPDGYKEWEIENEILLPGVLLHYWAVRSSVAVLPPALFYLFLFHVVPWVYRGFKPA